MNLLAIAIAALGLSACAASSATRPGTKAIEDASTGQAGTADPADQAPPAAPATGVAQPEQAMPEASAADTGPQVQLINQPGQLVTLERVLVPGKITVVEFFADWCSPCKVIEKQLVAAIHDEPRIAVRKIDIADDTSEVARHYGVTELPHIRIYDARGELVFTLVGKQAESAGQLARDVVPGQSQGQP